MSDELDIINQQLDILLSLKLNDEIPPEMRAAWAERAMDLAEQYEKAMEIAASDKASDKQKKYATEVCSAISKGLPDMTKAAIAAAAAFKAGDPVRGSAEVMNMCASVAPILGALLSAGPLLGAAGGPAGLVVGALFSIIGQIISLFAPKSDSLLDQIDKLLSKLDQEAQKLSIKTVAQSTNAFAHALRDQIRTVRTLLRKPLANHNDFLILEREVENLRELLRADNPLNTIKMFTAWEVLEWLKLDNKQDLSGWPEILGIFCKTYLDMETSTLGVALLLASSDMQKRMLEFAPGAEAPANYSAASHTWEDDRKAIENKLNSLIGAASLHERAYASCSTTVLPSLKEILPAARSRGLFFLNFDGSRGVFVGSGKNVLVRERWSQIWNNCKRITITRSAEDNNSFDPPLAPRYHFWALDQTEALYHARLNSLELADPSASRRAMVGDELKMRGGASEFSDICARPAPGYQPGSYVYCSRVNMDHGKGVQLFQLDNQNKFTDVPFTPQTKSPLLQLRIAMPWTPLKDDPDKDAMPKDLLDGGDILYGALQKSTEIYVAQSNQSYYVPAPWAYTGIAIDPWMVWVFGKDRAACASHASIVKYIQKKRATPNWLALPDIERLVYDTESQGSERHDAGEGNFWTNTRGTDRPALRGLLDLSPCEDGSILLSTWRRKITKKQNSENKRWEFTAHDTAALWTANYRIDFAGNSVACDHWTKLPGGAEAFQVQKLPIPCWGLLNSLVYDLMAKGKG